MKQTFTGREFTAIQKAKNVLGMWNIMHHDVTIAYVYEETEEIAFESPAMRFTVPQLQDIKELATSIHRQYVNHLTIDDQGDDTIEINTTKSQAVHHWMMKEYGSWEDHNKDQNHACALLQNFGGPMTLTARQARNLIDSGAYTVSGYNDDEIEGGQQTKKVIRRYVELIKTKLAEINQPAH